MYDRDLILSWRPSEYRAFLEGSQDARIDSYEDMAMNALMIRKANNDKKIKGIKDLFDAEKARKRTSEDDDKKRAELKKQRYKKAVASMKNYKP